MWGFREFNLGKGFSGMIVVESVWFLFLVREFKKKVFWDFKICSFGGWFFFWGFLGKGLVFGDERVYRGYFG